MSSIQLEPKHLEIVQKILKRYAIVAYVFGSRAKNCAKPFSDLDLCLKTNYDKSAIRKLENDFEESDLPFKVDIVLWSEISESFRAQIESDLLILK